MRLDKKGKDNISQNVFMELKDITFDSYINKDNIDIEKITFIRLYTKDYGG